MIKTRQSLIFVLIQYGIRTEIQGLAYIVSCQEVTQLGGLVPVL